MDPAREHRRTRQRPPTLSHRCMRLIICIIGARSTPIEAAFCHGEYHRHAPEGVAIRIHYLGEDVDWSVGLGARVNHGRLEAEERFDLRLHELGRNPDRDGPRPSIGHLHGSGSRRNARPSIPHSSRRMPSPLPLELEHRDRSKGIGEAEWVQVPPSHAEVPATNVQSTGGVNSLCECTEPEPSPVPSTRRNDNG